LPDPRDLTPSSPAVRAMLEGVVRLKASRARRLARVDWREYLGPVGDQRVLGSSASYACLGLAQYFERRAHGRRLDGSARFLYKTARQLLNWPGDTGVTLRATLRALTRFGLPPESFCPDDPEDFDAPLDPFLFGFTEVSRSLRYARLDPSGEPTALVLPRVKAWLASGFACALGVVLFDSITCEEDVPFPTALDAARGGQAVVAAGYDDTKRIRSTRGALLVRNSWGAAWGAKGDGWLPYAYVERGLAADFWTLLRPDWLASGEFLDPGPD
jgi:C1A family cysteine protease